MRIAVATAVACLTTIGLSTAQEVQAAIKKHTTIPAQGLGPALQQLARDRDVQLVYRSEVVGSRETSGATGELTFEEALTRLLEGTGLTFQYLEDNAITIIPLQNSSSLLDDDAGGGGESLWDRFRLAQLDQGSQVHLAQETSAQGSVSQLPGADASGSLEEIIVTAQKRSERLQDVPVPVTALSAAQLIDNNKLRLQDYYTSVPGFMVAPTSKQTSQVLAIRGLTTGQGAPTVGIVIDDVPYGSSTALGGGQGIPDLDPGDLARIEVLRGPQGTLYGANSLGGLVKFVTVDPSTDAVSGRLQAGVGSVRNGDELGYNVRGSINVPLSETLAVRGSAFTRMEPGWIDNPARNIEGINEENAYGGRLSALWSPSDSLSLKLGAMYQSTQADAVSSVDLLPGLGELDQSYAIDTANEKEVQAYSAVLTAQLGASTLTSLSGFNISSFDSQSDVTALYSDFTELFFGVPGTAVTGVARTEKFSQEVRLAVPLGDSVDWLIGAYYSKEDTAFDVDFIAVDADTQQIVDHYVLSDFPSTYRELAGFTDFTFRLTDRFDVQVGGRYSDIQQHATEFDEGFVYNTFFFNPPRPNPYLSTPEDLKADSFTYLLTPRFNITPDVMVYARLASGYRAGGVNITSDTGVPQGYDPDKTENYEIGVKAEFLDGIFSLDASVYYIDWSDIQLFLNSPTSGAGYIDNGGRARSEGVEIAFQTKLPTDTTIGGWVAWNTAELTEDLPPGSLILAGDGDRLPFSSRISGKLAVEQQFPLFASSTGFIGADVSYIGDRRGTFVMAGERSVMPAYARTDVRAGVQFESWTANLFVNNVTDRRGILIRGDEGGLPFSVNYIQPRTIGLSLVKSF